MPRHTYDVVLNGHVIPGVTSEAEYNFLSDLPAPEVSFDPGWSVRTSAIQAIRRHALRNDTPTGRSLDPADPIRRTR